jgi:hypothetical protein
VTVLSLAELPPVAQTYLNGQMFWHEVVLDSQGQVGRPASCAWVIDEWVRRDEANWEPLRRRQRLLVPEVLCSVPTVVGALRERV